MNTPSSFASPVALAGVVAGCAAALPLAPANVPSSLEAPPGSSLYLEVLASGGQVYECAQRSDSTYEWTFKAPEAALSDRAGQPLGKHYAGPTWEANDGSSVVGEVRARDSGPATTAIPWLLLAAKSNSGTGTFADAKFIQRVATVGGVAPVDGCNAATLKQRPRVPYSATYFFYR